MVNQVIFNPLNILTIAVGLIIFVLSGIGYLCCSRGNPSTAKKLCIVAESLGSAYVFTLIAMALSQGEPWIPLSASSLTIFVGSAGICAMVHTYAQLLEIAGQFNKNIY